MCHADPGVIQLLSNALRFHIFVLYLHFSRLSQMPACQTWSFSEANAVCWENLHTLSDNNPRLDLNANIHNIGIYILPTNFFTVAATSGATCA